MPRPIALYKRPAFAPRTVIAYHGCSEEIAEKVQAEGRFLSSTNTYDWLGAGVCFWEYAPNRALRWAEELQRRRGGAPAVLGATIRLGRCLNLLDTAYAEELTITYQKLVEDYAGRKMPPNTDSGAHFLDRAVIDTFCLLTVEEESYAYQTVRGSYPEGDPLFPGSKILSLARTQIAVRDPACISQIHRVDFSQARKTKRGRS